MLLCLLSFLLCLTSFIRSSFFLPLSYGSRFGSVLLSAVGGCFLLVFVLLPCADAHVVEGLRRGWLCMFAMSVSALLLALLKAKPDRCFPVHCMRASSLLSCPLASCLYVILVLVYVLVHVHAWRWRPLRVSYMSSCDAALLTQALCVFTALPPVLLLHHHIMAEAVPAVPRQQRRKEARAQASDDVRQVCQRMDDTDVRLDNLEGRLRGHDLRLQYLEAPLKLVLKKLKAPVEFWAAKDNRFQAAKSAFSAAFLQELRESGGAIVQHLLEEAEAIMAELDSRVIIGIFRTGGVFAG